MSKYARALILLCGVAFCFQILLNCYASDFKAGYCPLTGKQIINEGKALSNYKIVWFELSNGSHMPVAVDSSISKVDEKDFEAIMEWVRQGWLYEIYNKKWTPEEIQSYKDTFFNLKIARQIE